MDNLRANYRDFIEKKMDFCTPLSSRYSWEMAFQVLKFLSNPK